MWPFKHLISAMSAEKDAESNSYYLTCTITLWSNMFSLVAGNCYQWELRLVAQMNLHSQHTSMQSWLNRSRNSQTPVTVYESSVPGVSTPPSPQSSPLPPAASAPASAASASLHLAAPQYSCSLQPRSPPLLAPPPWQVTLPGWSCIQPRSTGGLVACARCNYPLRDPMIEFPPMSPAKELVGEGGGGCALLSLTHWHLQ